MTSDIRLLLPTSIPLDALMIMVDLVRYFATRDIFSRMDAEGTARITASASSRAASIFGVIVISLEMVIPGKRSGPVFLSLLASRAVLAHSLTSIPFFDSNVESVIPQLVVPITATFCIYVEPYFVEYLWIVYFGVFVEGEIFAFVFSPIFRSVPLKRRRILSRCMM